MSIMPLPVFEADADPKRRDGLTLKEQHALLKPPSTVVVRVGSMMEVAEYPYRGDVTPGCGSKLIARTHRGTEIVEMLTTTCSNSGCGKSVSRKQMLEYIDNSGGKDYPFRTDGRVLRVATVEDMNRMSGLKTKAKSHIPLINEFLSELNLEIKIVDVEPVLSEEMLTIYYMAEDRVDFRDLVRKIAAEVGSRIEMRQVGARDEARIVADYERCGQHCCCKNFLKVLKPVSMRSAKTQKATLDPLKISGRCGRLMCCLRYEDETYSDLKSRLPHRKTRVGTTEGPGIVMDSKILVQLVLVKLESDGREIAVAVEELMDPDACPDPSVPEVESDPLRGLEPEEAAARTGDRSRRRRRRKPKAAQQDSFKEDAIELESDTKKDSDQNEPKRQSRRRRRGKSRTSSADQADQSKASPESTASGSEAVDGTRPQGAKKKRRRRGRRRRGGKGESDTNSKE